MKPPRPEGGVIIGQGRAAWLATAVGGFSALLAACTGLFETVCTAELRSSLVVEVRDTNGEPAARGVTGVSVHESGLATELSAFSDLRLGGDWHRELGGRHSIRLRKQGHTAEVVDVFVPSDRCHVETTTVQMEISPDPRAEALDPVSFSEGPEVDASPASAGVQVFGDTLEIRGFAPTECAELRAVAYRLGIGVHVQIEPSGRLLDVCVSPRQFAVRYLLPPDRVSLLVTSGFSFPVELFNGQVAGGTRSSWRVDALNRPRARSGDAETPPPAPHLPP